MITGYVAFKAGLPKTDDAVGRGYAREADRRYVLHAGVSGPVPYKEHPARLSELPLALEALFLCTLGA